MRIFGKSLELLLLCSIILGGAYVGISAISERVANSMNDTAVLIEEGPR